MTQKFDIGLNAKINEFSKKFDIVRTEINDEDIFEDFGNYLVTSVFLEEELENMKSVSTNKAQGIDGIVIIVNDKLVTEESDLDKFGPTESLKIKIGFIQSTIKKSFDEQKFSTFIDQVVKFLTGDFNIEPFSVIYKKLFDENSNYINRISETPRISLFFLSGRTSHSITEDKINSEKAKIMQRGDIENRFQLDNIYIFQKEEIKTEYDKISKFHTCQLEFRNSIPLDQRDGIELSLLATIRFSEFKKLILTTEGNLMEKLFVENVRSYIGQTNVNLDIKKTLDMASERDYFPFLNNGIVIICDKIERHPVRDKIFNLTFPRIINGCQTTNELFKKYKEGDDIDNVEVVVKIISTQDNNLKKRIIYSANNQNPISADLHSLNTFNEKIEEYFEGKKSSSFQLYFERLRGQYPYITPPYSKINTETLARIFVSVHLKKPHDMKTNALSIIGDFQKKEIIFNKSHRPEQYYYYAILWYWLNNFLSNNKIVIKSKTMDMHILMACDILLEKEGKITVEEKIEYLDNLQNSENLFLRVTDFVNNADYLFERRGLYSNPKTQQLINDIQNANTPTNN